MKSSILDKISSPKDIKKLSFEELAPLCTEIRQLLIETTAKTGGHLASNLGTVELTVALHRIFEALFYPASGKRLIRLSEKEGKHL